ncbi:MAG TPA: cyclase family protein [Gammaproteobacteria bacterium]|nr:cyclase family protein [Gammaproteobacteria bacterium]
MPRFIDLSHPIEEGMVTYPGLPAPHICDFWSRASTAGRYAPGVTFQIGRIDMVANTGTYLDAPFHRYAAGTDIAGLALSSLAELEGVCVRVPEGMRRIDASFFSGLVLRRRAVLVATGWDRFWNTPHYGEGHPFLTRDAAALLSDAEVALVGIDSLNIDDSADPERPVHSILLGAGIPIVEHLAGLGALPPSGFTFSAVPAPVRGMGSFPVRAYARLPD